MTADQAIADAAFFNRYGLHLDTMAADLIRFGANDFARLSIASCRDALAIGETATAEMYINRAQWALDASK